MVASVTKIKATLMALDFSKALSLAHKLESQDLFRRRQHIQIFMEKSRRVQQSKILLSITWLRLLRRHLQILDIQGAEDVVRLVGHSWRTRVAIVSRDLETLRAETAPFIKELRHAIAAEQVSAPIVQTEFDTSPKKLTIFMPSHLCACLSSRDDTPRNQIGKDLRILYAHLFDTLRSQDIGYDARIQLRTGHGKPVANSRYIAFHSQDNSNDGLHIKQTDRPHCYSVDRHGYSGWSAFADLPLDAILALAPDRATVERAFETDKATIIAGNQSKYRQPPLLQLARSSEAKSPTIFVALQTANDAVQQLAYMPMLDMLAEVAQFGRDAGYRVVVKRHPHCQDRRVTDALRKGNKSGLFTVSRASIHDLIINSTAVCTVNSSVGAEALLHMKPVYTFGRSEYRAACFEIQKKGEFAAIFAHERPSLPAFETKCFLYALRHEFARDIRDPGFPRWLYNKVAEFYKAS